ncbi:MAG TPA: hypothetical protein VJ731_00610 [Terriglobales bacterium]|nr:hypothetical protein [Terriglobales bacterium]
MKTLCGTWFLLFSLGGGAALAQVPQVVPRVLASVELKGKVTTVEVAVRFVTTIRLPEAVNSVALGDPSKFEVEHSDKEPKLVFVKAITIKPAETNLMISTATGRQVSLLLISRGEHTSLEQTPVDFVVSYQTPRDFLIPPSGFPFAIVGQTISLDRSDRRSGDAEPVSPGEVVRTSKPRGAVQNLPLDRLLEEQESSPLPALYGEHIQYKSRNGDRVRTGVGRVIDGGDEVIVLFSVVNPTKQPILLMPPQVQLAGRTSAGKFIRHGKWLTSEQLPVLEYRLSRSRLGPRARADGVALFKRPPYKQSNEMLLLQIAEAGAVDRPALAPIGFGVSGSQEAENDGRK